MVTIVKTIKPRTYTAKVTGRHAITLQAQLCRDLGIEVGDTVELELAARQRCSNLSPAKLTA